MLICKKNSKIIVWMSIWMLKQNTLIYLSIWSPRGNWLIFPHSKKECFLNPYNPSKLKQGQSQKLYEYVWTLSDKSKFLIAKKTPMIIVKKLDILLITCGAQFILELWGHSQTKLTGRGRGICKIQPALLISHIYFLIISNRRVCQSGFQVVNGL